MTGKSPDKDKAADAGEFHSRQFAYTARTLMATYERVGSKAELQDLIAKELQAAFERGRETIRSQLRDALDVDRAGDA